MALEDTKFLQGDSEDVKAAKGMLIAARDSFREAEAKLHATVEWQLVKRCEQEVVDAKKQLDDEIRVQRVDDYDKRNRERADAQKAAILKSKNPKLQYVTSSHSKRAADGVVYCSDCDTQFQSWIDGMSHDCPKNAIGRAGSRNGSNGRRNRRSNFDADF